MVLCYLYGCDFIIHFYYNYVGDPLLANDLMVPFIVDSLFGNGCYLLWT